MKSFYATIYFLSFLCIAPSAFGQENILSSAQLDSLYAERLQLSNNGQDYAAIEMYIVKSGIYPSALAEKSIEAAGVRYLFSSYSPISGFENQQAVENRYKSMFPDIQSIEIREDKVNVLLSPNMSSENLALFFHYLGYKNIQLKN